MSESPAKTVMERCDLLGKISEENGALTRPYGSEAMREVNEIFSGWMREAGMEVVRDGIGNLTGRYEGEGEKTLVLGSHLDTVRDAGKYDGQLGVLVALACIERLRESGERLPFSVELTVFADEEGLRFGTTYLGSSVYTGAFDEKLLDLTDGDGVTIAEAVRDFGGEPERLGEDVRDGNDLLGYCEVHIEQGPVLESLGLPVGIVTAITGQTRATVSFSGEAGHAGTVPMQNRRDALCAAAEFVLEVESEAKAEPGAVGTVGEVSVLPGASNVIPGKTILSLDLRHQDDVARERLRDRLEAKAKETAASRECECSWEVRHEASAVPTDADLNALLERAVEDCGVEAHRLPSGAGHDAASMARITGSAMLFVRCKEGISHNPAESVEEEDAAKAIEVVGHFLKLVADRASGANIG